METSGQLEIDGMEIKPISLRFYEELVNIELNSSDSDRVFTKKSDLRYATDRDYANASEAFIIFASSFPCGL